MSRKRKPTEQNLLEHVFKEEFNLERLVFFSDAVIAIAITLLAVDIRAPELQGPVTALGLQRAVMDMEPQFLSFTISFFVIGIYWMGHHRTFGYIKGYDGRLIWLNLLFLFFVAILPFTTNLLGRYGDFAFVNAVYAANAAACGAAMTGLWFYASRVIVLSIQNWVTAPFWP